MRKKYYRGIGCVMQNGDNLRQLYLLKILFERTDENHPISTTEIIHVLSEEYGVAAHRQTVKNDILSFQQFGLDIMTERKQQNEYKLLSRNFSIAELKILIDAVQSARFITAAKSKALTKKLTALASVYSATELKRNLNVERRIKSSNEHIFYIVDKINEAINTHKKIAFQYFRYSAKKEKVARHNGEIYRFSPYYLVWNGDYYYVIGYSDKHLGVGSFRLDRFVNPPDILMEAAVPEPKGFDLLEYINTMFRMYDSEHTEVELICDNDTMDAIIDKFGTGVITKQIDKETFRAKVNVAVNHIFFSWIFGFCGKVRIAGPDKVQKQYTQMLEDAIKANRI